MFKHEFSSLFVTAAIKGMLIISYQHSDSGRSTGWALFPPGPR